MYNYNVPTFRVLTVEKGFPLSPAIYCSEIYHNTTNKTFVGAFKYSDGNGIDSRRIVRLIYQSSTRREHSSRRTPTYSLLAFGIQTMTCVFHTDQSIEAQSKLN